MIILHLSNGVKGYAFTFSELKKKSFFVKFSPVYLLKSALNLDSI